ncbi:MDIS1-interacting receptor like kinase 2-like [Miscanthus floridulus]|uniref:MDIS1-interacting receptor like kinase 2-like n=1 Tax=Miscanthus floridulus TaxID=154761 RepID=UPI00345A0CD4
MGNLTTLNHLSLGKNQFVESIPAEIGALVHLHTLSLSQNEISGSIPATFANLTSIRFQYLHLNKLSVDLCRRLLGGLQMVLDVSSNKLMGNLPAELGNLVMLEVLNLSHNQFSGSIPSSIGSMASLSTIDVSYNNMGGPLPIGHQFHNASAKWFLHNKGLWKRPQITTVTDTRDVLSVWNFDGKLVFEDITRVTENFNDRYIIGSGGFGIVYKARLQGGRLVAVKKFHPIEEGISDEKRFLSEIEVLIKIRHRSIVKFYGFCSHPRFKFLVYDYIERGNLHVILENEDFAKELDWQKRVAIARDVAQAIYYLHHECNPPIIHRDITSNNILLDAAFKAYVSDFGIATMLKPDSSNWSELAGRYGYIAPGIIGRYKSTCIE